MVNGGGELTTDKNILFAFLYTVTSRAFKSVLQVWERKIPRGKMMNDNRK